jgi:hypothetical protein
MNTNTHTHTHTHTHAPSRKHIEETKNFAAKMSEFTGLKGDAHPSNLVNTQWKVCVCVYVRKREKVCVCIGMSLYSYLLSHTHTLLIQFTTSGNYKKFLILFADGR